MKTSLLYLTLVHYLFGIAQALSCQTALLFYLCCQPRRVLADFKTFFEISNELERYKEMLTDPKIPAIEEEKEWKEVLFVQSIKISKTRLGIHLLLLL